MALGVLRRLADLRRSDDDLAADELRAASTRQGCTMVGVAHDRAVVDVAGTIRSVTLRPRVTVPALAAELYDGSCSVTLVWLGRREIRGIEPGAYLRATGRLCHPKGLATIFNPDYQLSPRRGH